VGCGPCISFGVDQCLPGCIKLIHFLPLLLCSYLDDRYARVLDLEALKKWRPWFPLFAEKIRVSIGRDRNGIGYDGSMQIQTGVHFEPGTFRIAGFFDCKDWQTARPGSGLAGDYELAQRRPEAYHAQRAFYGGHHGHNGVKTFSIVFPNGLNFVSNVYSCRRNDCLIVEWTGIDNFLETIYLAAGDTHAS
jgi:hypothetical protein